MGGLEAFGAVTVVAAILTYLYLLYIRRSFGQRMATALAILVFVLLLLLLGGEFCGRSG